MKFYFAPNKIYFPYHTRIIGIENNPTPQSDYIFAINCNDFDVKFFHAQDCCEVIWLDEVIGDLNAIANTQLRYIEITKSTEYSISQPINRPYIQCDDGYYTDWTFYTIQTDKDAVTLRFCGETNSQYALDVDILIETKG